MAEQEDDKNKLGKYELVTVIASGSSCQIWEATDGNQPWAIKTLLPEKLSEAEERASLRHEGKILQKLSHPVFVMFREMTISRKQAFLVMEYFRAPNLKSVIKTNRVSIHIRLERMLEQLCLGLGYMHEQGLIHRDLKPDNILFSKSGELKLIDFSLATRFKTGIAAALSGKQKSIQGTRTYIAPETIMKRQPTPQTDMYSLGITLYEVLTGRTPFAGASPNDLLLKHLMDPPLPPSHHEPNVSAELDQFVLKLLAKKPKDRFADMNEAYTELRSMSLFKEEPGSLDERQKVADKAKQEASYEEVLDSRKDAERTAAGISLPKRETKKTPKVLPKTEKNRLLLSRHRRNRSRSPRRCLPDITCRLPVIRSNPWRSVSRWDRECIRFPCPRRAIRSNGRRECSLRCPVSLCPRRNLSRLRQLHRQRFLPRNHPSHPLPGIRRKTNRSYNQH